MGRPKKPTVETRHKAFALEFIKSWDGATAYEAVYPNVKHSTALVNSSKLLKEAKVKEIIAERMAEKAMGANEALARLSDIARGSHRPFIRINDEGFVEFDFSHPDAMNNMHLIKSIHTKRKILMEGKGKDAEAWEHEWVEVELYDAKSALVDILKINGRFIEHTDITTNGEKVKGYVLVSPDDWKTHE